MQRDLSSLSTDDLPIIRMNAPILRCERRVIVVDREMPGAFVMDTSVPLVSNGTLANPLRMLEASSSLRQNQKIASMLPPIIRRDKD